MSKFVYNFVLLCFCCLQDLWWYFLFNSDILIICGFLFLFHISLTKSILALKVWYYQRFTLFNWFSLLFFGFQFYWFLISFLLLIFIYFVFYFLDFWSSSLGYRLEISPFSLFVFSATNFSQHCISYVLQILTSCIFIFIQFNVIFYFLEAFSFIHGYFRSVI